MSDNSSDGSDVNLSGIDSDLDSLDTVASRSSVASFSDGTYTDVSFDQMQEFLDDDHSDSSDLEQECIPQSRGQRKRASLEANKN